MGIIWLCLSYKGYFLVKGMKYRNLSHRYGFNIIKVVSIPYLTVFGIKLLLYDSPTVKCYWRQLCAHVSFSVFTIFTNVLFLQGWGTIVQLKRYKLSKILPCIHEDQSFYQLKATKSAITEHSWKYILSLMYCFYLEGYSVNYGKNDMYPIYPPWSQLLTHKIQGVALKLSKLLIDFLIIQRKFARLSHTQVQKMTCLANTLVREIEFWGMIEGWK